ncbi:uncharacterized protein LOC133350572 [Lethenteron reissneri]|uniref:uncharacterized protein LOC133350572 n=1 Tax=Lethenteron reissneri TaxID=7753 RepID=UPI002AB7D9D1|nr:uncharacterized protein LOC133350572 [Lethenteron reissneri]
MLYPVEQSNPAAATRVAAQQKVVPCMEEAIRGDDLQACLDLLLQDPGQVNVRGWSGLGALHHACFRGSVNIAAALLQHEADPNLCNDAGETPFHFACRRGNVAIIHRLVQSGADVTLLDKYGRSGLHHATVGGSVLALKYLEETGKFHFLSTDTYSQNPLHIAAGMGNLDVVCFLLAKKRIDCRTRDADGNTALHLATLKGHSALCWPLLQAGGMGLFALRNRDGLTPVELARSCNTYMHKHLSEVLENLERRSYNGKSLQPLGIYYGLMLLPGVGAAAGLALSSLVPAYSGYLIMALFIALTRTVLGQTHRIWHISRWQNPIYFGIFIAGIIHSLFCFYYKLLPILWPAPALLVSSVVITTLLGLAMCSVLLRDPGRLRPQCGPPGSGLSSVHELLAAGEPTQRFCISCELVQPAWTKHCRLCDACMEGMDHHCLFLLVCVARRNHRAFVLLLVLVALCQFCFSGTVVAYLARVVPPSPGGGGGGGGGTHLAGLRPDYGRWAAAAALAMTRDSWPALLLLVNVGCLLWVCCLLAMQLSYVAAGVTTVLGHPAGARRHRGGLLRGLANVLRFLVWGEHAAAAAAGVGGGGGGVGLKTALVAEQI